MRSSSPSASRALRYAGDRVRQDRLDHAWSQRELERRSGVDQTTISRLERGLAPGLRLEAFASLLLALRTLGPDAPARIDGDGPGRDPVRDPWRR